MEGGVEPPQKCQQARITTKSTIKGEEINKKQQNETCLRQGVGVGSPLSGWKEEREALLFFFFFFLSAAVEKRRSYRLLQVWDSDADDHRVARRLLHGCTRAVASLCTGTESQNAAVLLFPGAAAVGAAPLAAVGCVCVRECV